MPYTKAAAFHRTAVWAGNLQKWHKTFIEIKLENFILWGGMWCTFKDLQALEIVYVRFSYIVTFQISEMATQLLSTSWVK